MSAAVAEWASPLGIAALLGWAAAGAALALGYFRAVRQSAALFVAGGSAARAVALTLLRMAAAVALLTLAARQGTAPLLAAAAGFAGGRWTFMARARREAAQATTQSPSQPPTQPPAEAPR